MEIIQYPQQNADANIVGQIIRLENTAWPQEAADAVFPSAPDTYVTSFVTMEENMVVCHVGVRKSILYHKGEEYRAYGLSGVVTHPQYRGRGLASQTIRKALQFIISKQADISVFTCTKEQAAFYERYGWEAMLGTCFAGGTKEKPFRSDSFDLITMMMFLSPKSKLRKKDFENTDLIFELGENQLW